MPSRTLATNPARNLATRTADTTSVLRSAKRAARHFDGVIGVDLGYVYHDAIRTEQIGIRYHVSRKRPLRSLRLEEKLPRKMEGLRVDVLEAGYRPHGTDPFSPASVLQPGLSIGNVARSSEGTLGCFVRDSVDGGLCVLSNWHVLCGSTICQVGDVISHPGPMFLGGSEEVRQIALLRRWVAPPTGLDAAIANLPRGFSTAENLLGSQTTILGVRAPALGMSVIKSGMASGITHALVDGVNGSYLVPYDQFPKQNCWMRGIHLVVNTGFNDPDVSQPGDSGSVWVDLESNSAVGLHFAGEDDGGPLKEYALAHALSEVVDVLRVRVDP